MENQKQVKVNQGGIKKHGPTTEEGRRRIALRQFKTGIWAKDAVEQRREARRLIHDAKGVLKSLADVWQKDNPKVDA